MRDDPAQERSPQQEHPRLRRRGSPSSSSRSLGAADRRKLDEYLTGVRELEQRISRPGPRSTWAGPSYPRPLGIPADYQEHLRLMGDLLVLAFQCDLTRIVTFVFANDGSNRSYRSVGVPDGHHDLSHHGGDTAKHDEDPEDQPVPHDPTGVLLQKLKSIPEGDGTLLDHCMIVYGSGISDGNAHSHDDLPILLAGKANGTIKTGPAHSLARRDAADQPLRVDARPNGRSHRTLRRQHGRASQHRRLRWATRSEAGEPRPVGRFVTGQRRDRQA